MSLYPSHMQRSPMRQPKRPGTLNEWPLDEFLLGMRLAASPFKDSKKRPVSPANASPEHKQRRVIMSPEKLPSLQSRLTKYAAMSDEPSKAAAALFALSRTPSEQEAEGSSATSIQSTPKRHPKPALALAPSPELHSSTKTNKHASVKRRDTVNDSFADAMMEEYSIPSPAPAPCVLKGTYVARDLPPSPDRESEHYPGFDIFRDPCVYVPHPSECTAPRPPSPPVSGDEEQEGGGKDKENEPVAWCPERPKMAKTATVPGSPLKQSITFSPEGTRKKVARKYQHQYQSMPVSPMKALRVGGDDKDAVMDLGATPRARGVMPLGEGFDVPMRNATPREKKWAARRMMEEEVDEPEGGDELFL
ncbi:hypothetical protein OE88DRAFT_1651895 [Heliocybe sulcata]|uniref:Uncharacterized protein n=1 Tax=Heliocybe sulcata TaxID=5364 RepID=A0A5C3NPD0_9AGAM|nr:hypothetical protein OE88DRAFT_1651895 [Heliocybe sulcata]